MAQLPKLPEHHLVVEGELDASSHPFLQVRSRQCRVNTAAGETTRPFRYDTVVRSNPDAVVVVAHFERAGERRVYLRSCVRPPLRFRSDEDTAFPHDGSLWELPAGLIDERGNPLSAARLAAARETREELGFELLPELFAPLGPPIFPLAGVMAEAQYFLSIEVDPQARGVPTEDGPLERAGAVIDVRVIDALRACAEGLIPDAKTELGLRRLAESCPDRR